jgi:DNA-binding NtrC family response regulator
VVDDDDDTCVLLAHVLSTFGGYEIALAHTSLEALGALAKSPAALIIDYMLGTENGKGVIEEAQRLGVPTCWITAANSIAGTVQIPVLFKPFHTADLLEVVQRLVKHREVDLPNNRQSQLLCLGNRHEK